MRALLQCSWAAQMSGAGLSLQCVRQTPDGACVCNFAAWPAALLQDIVRSQFETTFGAHSIQAAAPVYNTGKLEQMVRTAER